MNKSETLGRIEAALAAASALLARFVPGAVEAQYKSPHDPVTEADRAVDELLRGLLVRNGEGWFSEETVDDLERLDRKRVWLVDPLDGTREFVAGIPEWCVSIGLVEEGKAVAGGIANPATGEIFLGSLPSGVEYNGRPVRTSTKTSLKRARVLASRSEVKRGEWERFQGERFTIQPVGSIAYKLALVAAGLADATWTFAPKNEWDVAAGVALVEAGGGFVLNLAGSPLTFNNRVPLLSGLVAGALGLQGELTSLAQIACHQERGI